MKKEESKLEFKFILKFLTRYLILLLLIILSPLSYNFLTNLTLLFSAGLLKLFFNSIAVNNNIITINSKIFIELIPACIAISAYILLLILNLTTFMSLRKRFLSIILSFIFLFIVNILRILIFSILYYNNFLFFDFTHKLFWYFLSTIIVVGIWFLIVKIFSIKQVPVYSDMIYLMRIIKQK